MVSRNIFGFALITFFLVESSCMDQKPEKKISPVLENNMLNAKGLKIEMTSLASESDLVCGMSVKEVVADTVTFEGKLYGFCSTGCKDEFVMTPKNFIK